MLKKVATFLQMWGLSYLRNLNLSQNCLSTEIWNSLFWKKICFNNKAKNSLHGLFLQFALLSKVKRDHKSAFDRIFYCSDNWIFKTYLAYLHKFFAAKIVKYLSGIVIWTFFGWILVTILAFSVTSIQFCVNLQRIFCPIEA